MRRPPRWPLPTVRAADFPSVAPPRILATPETIQTTAAAVNGCGFFVPEPPGIHPPTKEKTRDPRASQYLDAACNYLDRQQKLPPLYTFRSLGGVSCNSVAPPHFHHLHNQNKRGGGSQLPRDTDNITHKLTFENLLTSWLQSSTLSKWRKTKQP